MSTFKCPVVSFKLEKHPFADSLSIASIGEWSAVVRTNDFENEKLGVYIPIDAIAPKDHTLLSFLEGKRVKACRLRKVLSQGVLLPFSSVEKWCIENHKSFVYETDKGPIGNDLSNVLGIKKYDPPVNSDLGTCDEISTPEGFDKYTDIENWKNFPDSLPFDTEVVVTEKIHGTNARFGLINGHFYVGSHNRTLAMEDYTNSKGELIELKPTAWHEIFKSEDILTKLQKLKEELNSECVVVYGEIFGYKVQSLDYGCKDNKQRRFRVFDIKDDQAYLSPLKARSLAQKVGFEVVPLLYQGPFTENVLNLRLGNDTISNSHIREGFVIEPVCPTFHRDIGRVKLKVKSEEYDMKHGGIEFKG